MTETSPREYILIVDDAPENISVVTGLLRGRYRLKAATSGEKALALLAAGELPDLILLDVMMPGMDGYEVCRRLKGDPKTREIPIIFLTARNQTEDEALGLELGAVDYITKPVKPAILFARIKTHLALSEATRRLADQYHTLIETAQLREDVEQILRHDLKVPLNVIIGGPEFLLANTKLTGQQREFIKIIGDAGYQMLEMINRSLDLYKMEKGIYKVNIESVDVIDVLRIVIREFDVMASEKSLGIKICMYGNDLVAGQEILIGGEKLLCHSILSNLIKNAIEASREGEPVYVNLQPGSPVRISIDNSGEVPHDIRPHFFEKFRTSGKVGGTGLGTYSAKLMVGTLGGRIELDTSRKGRTCVHVLLPPYQPQRLGEAGGSQVLVTAQD